MVGRHTKGFRFVSVVCLALMATATRAGLSRDEIIAAVNDVGAKATFIDDESKLVEIAVDRLASRQVIAWSQGRFEWGPRALGNRSILADPRHGEVKDIVNTKIKFREPFRPFAPAVLAESSSQYFDLPDHDRHMAASRVQWVVQQDLKPHVIPFALL